MKFEFGLTATDKITGLSGVITGFAKYITGCDQYLIAPPVDKEGKIVGATWLDENRLKIADGFDQVHLDTSEDTGPCEAAPIK